MSSESSKSFLETFYRSQWGFVLSFIANLVAYLQKPFMVYGYRDRKSGEFYKFTRLSSTVKIMNPNGLSLKDNVWIWHYSIIDATEGIEIEEGVQIGAYVGLFTHGSEHAIRLLGDKFVHIPNEKRLGYTRGGIKIGKYTFIGAGSVVLPGVTIGKGCLIGSGTLVNKNVPDYSILIGSPGEIKGSTLDLDKRFVKKFDVSETYYDAEAYQEILKKLG